MSTFTEPLPITGYSVCRLDIETGEVKRIHMPKKFLGAEDVLIEYVDRGNMSMIGAGYFVWIEDSNGRKITHEPTYKYYAEKFSLYDIIV